MYTGEAPGQAFKAWASGLDKVEFLLAAGPAEPLQPLRNVASGGESARVMLALKAAPSEAPSVFLGLWDSGACPDSQAYDGSEYLQEPGQSDSDVADAGEMHEGGDIDARARHILVEKSMHEERPRTVFRVLQDRADRVEEVADMLGLDAAVAEEMLDAAQSQ